MARYGMVIDLDKCSACQACVVACRIENNVPFAGPEDFAKGHAIFWNQFMSRVKGDYPDVKLEMFPRPCMHCENPPCTSVCPVGATYKNDDGIVVIRWDKCIGCKYCIAACPYSARSFNYKTPDIPLTLRSMQNPDRATDAQGYEVGPVPRPRGVVEKCTFCVHRIEKAKRDGKKVGTEHGAEGVVTACAQTCPAGAIAFGDLDDPESLVHKLSKDKRAHRLLEEMGTRPQVYYLSEG